MQENSSPPAPPSANGHALPDASGRLGWREAAARCGNAIANGALDHPGPAGTLLGALYFTACAADLITPYVGWMAVTGGMLAIAAGGVEKKGRARSMAGAAVIGAGLSGALLHIVKEGNDSSYPPSEDITQVLQGLCPDQLAPQKRFRIVRPDKTYVTTIADVTTTEGPFGQTRIETRTAFSYESFWTGRTLQVKEAIARVTIDPPPPGVPCSPLRSVYKFIPTAG